LCARNRGGVPIRADVFHSKYFERAKHDRNNDASDVGYTGIFCRSTEAHSHNAASSQEKSDFRLSRDSCVRHFRQSRFKS
jgi:hypothetical protein